MCAQREYSVPLRPYTMCVCPPHQHTSFLYHQREQPNRTVFSTFRLKSGDDLSLDRGVSHLVLLGIAH